MGHILSVRIYIGNLGGQLTFSASYLRKTGLTVFAPLIFLDPRSRSLGRVTVMKTYHRHLWTWLDLLGDGKPVTSALGTILLYLACEGRWKDYDTYERFRQCKWC